MQAVLWIAAAAGLGWALLGPRPLAFWPAGVLLAAGAVLAGASALTAWRRRAGLGNGLWGVARHSDDRLGLQHRLTSALEQETRGPGDGLLSGALLADANRHVAGVEPSRLAPLADRYTLGAGLAALLVAIGLLPWPAPSTVEPQTGEAVAETATASPSVTIEDIAAAARQIGIDSTLRDVDALMVAASELDTLLREATRGLSQEEMNRRFEELIEMARMGYGDTPPAWIADAPSPTQSLANRIEDYQERRRQPSQPNDTPPAPTRADEEPPAEMAVAEGAGALTASQDAVASAPMDGPTLPGMPTDEDEEAREAPTQGAPVGASTQSGAGGGDMAGLGSQALQATPFVAEERQGSEMILEAAETGAGRRIKIDMTLPPAAMEGLQAGDGAESLADSPAAAGLQPDRDFVQAGDRVATSRYFTPVQPDEGPILP
ncbi:hypothetical protein [Pelagibacterium lacus]|nr:hypothetical protein [Pelagibacterium lacus]